jgi:hypothetical protein
MNYFSRYNVLGDGWHSLHSAIEEDFFYIRQHRAFGRASMLQDRYCSYLKHVRDLSRIEEEMDAWGIRREQVTRARFASHIAQEQLS